MKSEKILLLIFSGALVFVATSSPLNVSIVSGVERLLLIKPKAVRLRIVKTAQKIKMLFFITVILMIIFYQIYCDSLLQYLFEM